MSLGVGEIVQAAVSSLKMVEALPRVGSVCVDGGKAGMGLVDAPSGHLCSPGGAVAVPPLGSVVVGCLRVPPRMRRCALRR